MLYRGKYYGKCECGYPSFEMQHHHADEIEPKALAGSHFLPTIATPQIHVLVKKIPKFETANLENRWSDQMTEIFDKHANRWIVQEFQLLEHCV